MEEEIGLHNLKPSKGATKARKRVGRGPGSGTGKTSGRGVKGQKSRSGSHNMRAGFEGGQMPIYMRIGKLRGGHHKMSMPIGPFRTRTQPVNVESLAELFAAGDEVTPELMKQRGLVGHLRDPIKVLGRGDISIALKVSAEGFSATAKEKIEAAGGTVTVLGAPDRPAQLTNREAKRAAAQPAAQSAEADSAGAES